MWQHVKLSDALSWGPSASYYLLVDDDVKKPSKQKAEFALNKLDLNPILFLFQLVIEPSGAASVAAAFCDKVKAMDPNIVNIGVVLSGGNVDIDHLPWVSAKQY